ncbi:unnamed protein product [Sphenostylis stenocarpa]|uniref:Uncharacterized protein n=1 Tax=Sphenostylis stenocarpa TaxID=92480 RepID=A0AA86SAU2_9FABA|nr:unnamed protein product [Sphenostylis stenocarpa]
MEVEDLMEGKRETEDEGAIEQDQDRDYNEYQQLKRGREVEKANKGLLKPNNDIKVYSSRSYRLN